MATISWSSRELRSGVIRVTGSVTLSCGHKLTEYARARTEKIGRQVVTRLLTDQTQAHARECGR